MPRRRPALEDAAVKDERLKAQQERLRQQRIRLLRGELKATMERLHTIRRELRALGYLREEAIDRVAGQPQAGFGPFLFLLGLYAAVFRPTPLLVNEPGADR